MDNSNFNEKKELINDEIDEPSVSRASSRGGALTIEKDKIIILAAMAAFAIVLILAVLTATLVGGVENKGHKHSLTTVMELVDGKFNVLNRCSECDYSEYVERDAQGATVLVERAATCEEDGKRIYVLVVDGKELYCEQILPKTYHKINGVNVDELKNEDGYILYDSETISMVGGAEFSCGDDVVPGVFVCSECGLPCPVDVIATHVPEEKWIAIKGNEPTCTRGGAEILRCKNCKEILDERTVEAFGHSYNYALEWNKPLQAYFVKTSCANDCGYSLTEDVSGVSETEKVPGNCKNPGKIQATYVKNGVTIECTRDSLPSEDNHVFNEKEGVEVYDYEKGYTIPFAQVGTGVGVVCGSTSNQFYLKCKFCSELKTIEVKVPDHQYEVKQVKRAPSLLDNGVVTLACSHSVWCTKELVDVTIDKVVIGEGGNAELVPDGGDEYYDLYVYKTEIYGSVITLNVKIPKAK